MHRLTSPFCFALGVAQQFQMYDKMIYVKWLLPNAPFNREAMSQAWFMPKALPSAQKPRVPGHEDDESAPDDEEGIMKSVDYVDQLVEEEVARGTQPNRIVIGGFSQGCAVSLVWGLLGKRKDEVAGVVALSGYLPLADRIEKIRQQRGIGAAEGGKTRWFLAHGSRDMLVPGRLFEKEKNDLGKFVDTKELMEDHLYEGMSHSTAPSELRDLLGWLQKVLPE